MAVWLGNALLAAELLPLWSRMPPHERQPLPRLLRVGGGLDLAFDQSQTIVLNPPYGRVRLSLAARERWQATLFGPADRYGLFLHAAVERVRPGGVVAAIIPTSFLGGAYSQRLRAYRAREAPPVRLAFVDTRAGVFGGDVLQETCLAIFQKAASSREVACSQVTINGASARLELPAALLPLAREPAVAVAPDTQRRRTDPEGCPTRCPPVGLRLESVNGPLVWNRHKPQIGAR
ncbi:MAG: hypothetical protein WKF41_05475 [Gaiellaceae bacterium]